MRVMLYTGKGGVGKTTLAAATALRAARLGQRTIVLSTDPAHSLADAFDQPLGPEPTPIAPNLWGQETDVYYNLAHWWGSVQAWLKTILAWRGVDELMAEEMAVVPGMEELANLLWVNHHHDNPAFEVIVIDSAPTGETLRLLSFPEVSRWWLEHILPIQRKVARMVTPVLERFVDMPLPGAEVFDTVEDLMKEVDRLHSLLMNPEEATIRLVLNPEKMVIKEAQRTLTYLNLYNFPIDMVVCNRYIPDNVADPF